jgi:hypothetical protein
MSNNNKSTNKNMIKYNNKNKAGAICKVARNL